MLKLTDQTFDQVLRETDGAIAVKFYADWCGDCRRITPAFRGFAEKCPALTLAEVNTADSPELAERLNIRGIPTVIIFQDAAESARLFSRDAKHAAKLDEFLNQFCTAPV